MNLTIFGDSIMKGVLFENGRYVIDSSWERAITEQTALAIRNRSHFGCTITKALPALIREAERPCGSEEPVLLEFGGNDCDYDWAAISADPEGCHLCKTPPEVFAADYRRVVRMLRESGRRPLMLTLPPIHSRRYLDFICSKGLSKEKILGWLGDTEAIYRRQKTYSDLVTQIAREEQAEILDLRAAFPETPGELEPLLCDDGIHPSRMGQERIFDLLCDRARRAVTA